MTELVGLAPVVIVGPDRSKERSKYERMWAQPAYREVSPGEHWATTFLSQIRAAADAEVIDFGCGTGRGGLALALLGGMRVRLVDFAANCLDEDVAAACVSQSERIRFDECDLSLPIQWNAAYGYCCDVMEHIPPEQVATVLTNILASAQHVFFAISTVDDALGALIGEPLHLTVQPEEWWIEQIQLAGGVVHWHHNAGAAVAIYCSAWKSATEVLPIGTVNVDETTLEAQTIQNIEAGWMQAIPHDRQDRECILIAGGPSLPTQLAEIKALRAAGAALVTVNGAYGWALKKGLRPSAQIVLDARAFNSRFVEPVLDDCRYLIASQVHPSTLESLPRDRTWLWHSGVSQAAEAAARRHCEGGHFFTIPGGSTVVLRAIPLIRMLGFWRLHIFGFDSCIAAGRHHAYPQAENDHEHVIPVVVGGRAFECTPWMLHQANEFMGLVPMLGDEMELAVYGDGLIAHIVATGAAFQTQG